MKELSNLLRAVDAFLRDCDIYDVSQVRVSPLRAQQLIELRDAKAAYDRSVGLRNVSDLASRSVAP